MKALRRLTGLCLASLSGLVPAVRAQQNPPHIAYVLPAGGQRGTSFEVRVGGQFLSNTTDVHVSGGGIDATVIDYSRPMNAMQATKLRERLQELQKLPANAAVQKEIGDIRVKLQVFNSNRNINPVLAETVRLRLTLAPGAEPGKRKLRLGTPQGLSNPIVFCIGRMPEFREQESISVSAQPGANQPQISQAPTVMGITLPATVNGRIKPGLARPQFPARPGQQFTPGDADRYRFHAGRGLQLVVAASARDLIPYLADAVPGWFQATVALFDSEGRELAYDDDYRFHPDPVLHYSIPREGEYVIEIKDALYRGREDFVYRISLGELPFVTAVFPLGGKEGAKNRVRLSGWNLPTEKLTIKNQKAGLYPLSVRKGELASNTMPFMVDTLPEVLEKEPNDSAGNAQRIKLQVIVNGHIDRAGDWDVFRIDGRTGDQVVVEVYARRLDSPLDSILKLADTTGRQIAFNDDHEDKGSGLDTHHADSFIMATLPAKGPYFLYLGDAQQRGGAEYSYRLRISTPRPDFDLRIVPSSINAVGGMNVPITVYALRKDGFAGDIALSFKDAPRGFTISGGLVPANQDHVRLTLAVPPAPLKEALSMIVEGRTTIQGREIRHAAVPADDMMQAFAYRHLVRADELLIAVKRRGPFRSPATIIGEQSLKIPTSGTVRIQARIHLPANNNLGNIKFELSQPPEGIELREASQAQEGAEIVLEDLGGKSKPGLKGNLIINIFAERKPPAVNGKPAPNLQRIPLGTLPAIPFEVVIRD